MSDKPTVIIHNMTVQCSKILFNNILASIENLADDMKISFIANETIAKDVYRIVISGVNADE